MLLEHCYIIKPCYMDYWGYLGGRQPLTRGYVVHFNSVVSMVIAHPLKELKIGVKRASVIVSAHAYKHLSQLLSGVDQGDRYSNSLNI